MTGQQSTKHKTPAVLWLWTWQLQQVGSNIHGMMAPEGLDLRACTVVVILAGACMRGVQREGSDLTAHCQPASSGGGSRALTEQGARLLLPDSVTSSYLFVTKKSSVTNTCHRGIWVTILPCTRDSHFGKSEHYQCIQHKFAKI